MAVMSRQQRRANQKKLAKSKDIQAAIERLDKNSEEFAKKAFERFEKEKMPQIQRAAMAKTLLWNMAYLRLKCGYGKKRMLNYLSEIAEFFNDMEFDSVKTEDLLKLLDEELGIDTTEEIEKIKQRAQKSMQDRIARTGVKLVTRKGQNK